MTKFRDVPQLFSYLQSPIDEDRRPGLFVLTGSQQFGLLSHITQTLAGRAGIVELLPFSLHELQTAKISPKNIEELIFKGLYPPIYDRKIPPSNWYSNYVQTYLERDVRQMIHVHNLSAFQRFVLMCAARTGQLLNLSSLALDCGITHNTAKAWLSVLEESYIVFLLRPYFRKINKRLVKTPKIYFYDTGLAAWLIGIHDPKLLSIHPMRGALFETWTIGELMKNRLNLGLPVQIYFLRDNVGNEVDLLMEAGDQLTPVEIKSGETVTNEYFSGLGIWSKLPLNRSGRKWITYWRARSVRADRAWKSCPGEVWERSFPLKGKKEQRKNFYTLVISSDSNFW